MKGKHMQITPGLTSPLTNPNSLPGAAPCNSSPTWWEVDNQRFDDTDRLVASYHPPLGSASASFHRLKTRGERVVSGVVGALEGGLVIGAIGWGAGAAANMISSVASMLALAGSATLMPAAAVGLVAVGVGAVVGLATGLKGEGHIFGRITEQGEPPTGSTLMFEVPGQPPLNLSDPTAVAWLEKKMH